MTIFIGALIIVSGFFSLFYRALKAARKTRMQTEADDAEKRGSPRKAAKIRRGIEAVENPDRRIAAARIWIIILRTLAAVLAGISAERLARRTPGLPFPMIATFYTAALAFAILLSGDFAPSLIVRISPEWITVNFLPLFEALTLPLRPLFFWRGLRADDYA